MKTRRRDGHTNAPDLKAKFLRRSGGSIHRFKVMSVSIVCTVIAYPLTISANTDVIEDGAESPLLMGPAVESPPTPSPPRVPRVVDIRKSEAPHLRLGSLSPERLLGPEINVDLSATAVADVEKEAALQQRLRDQRGRALQRQAQLRQRLAGGTPIMDRTTVKPTSVAGQKERSDPPDPFTVRDRASDSIRRTTND